jgi:DNA-directed RNA polymerase subunit RPC12/RpoP
MSGTERAGARHLDQGRPLTIYSDRVYVVCPRCGSRAVVTERPGLPELRHYGELLIRPRRLACDDCALTREWTAERRRNTVIGVQLGGPDDPFFGRPLWLRTPCRGKVLWAYNERHLDALAAYVAATLRERGDGPVMSMVACLPSWIKAASHRDDVLRAIERLRARHAGVPRPAAAYGHETPRRRPKG